MRILPFVLMLLANLAHAEPPHAVVLHLQKIPPSVAQELEAALCSNPDFECQGQPGEPALKFFGAEQNGVATWYALSNSGLQLAKVSVSEKRYRIDHLWNAKAYAFSNAGEQIDDLADGERISIYPALYPISPDQYAIAVVRTRYSSHPRGGSEWHYADFVALRDDMSRLEQGERMFAALPFSCINQPTPSCPNDGSCEKWTIGKSEGYLTLKFVGAPGNGHYGWVATWHQSQTSEDPKGRGKTLRSVQTVKLTLGDPGLGEKVARLASDFCE